MPVLLRSRLLVLRGENKHNRVFRVRMKLRAAHHRFISMKRKMTSVPLVELGTCK